MVKGSKQTEEAKKKMSLANKGKSHLHTEESKRKMSESAKKVIHKPTQGFQKGHGLMGSNPTSKGKNWKLSEENKKNIGNAKKGNKYCLGKKNALGYKFTEEQIEDLMSKVMRGENHYRWIKDRDTLVKRDHNSLKDAVYIDWRRKVFERDNFICRMSNEECSGQLEAHHIFRWKDYPELRFLLTNGITLCHFHHPRKVEEEKRLIPLFQELVSVSKE